MSYGEPKSPTAPSGVLAPERLNCPNLGTCPLPRAHPPRPFRPRLRHAAPPVERRPRHAYRGGGLPRRQAQSHGPAPPPHQLHALVDRCLYCLRPSVQLCRSARTPANLAGQVSYLHGGSPLSLVFVKPQLGDPPSSISTPAANLWKTLRVSHSDYDDWLLSACLTSV